MNYVSTYFWLNILGLLAGYLILRLAFRGSWGSSWDRYALLVSNLLLFASESILSFGIFIGIALWIFCTLQIIAGISCEKRLWVVFFSIIIALQPLIFYKYWAVGRTSFVIPIGISFYTFQLIGLLVDSAREPRKRLLFVDFLNFASFFPQIVAGPIERRALLLPQLRDFRFRYNKENLECGLRFLVTGFFYKLVIADNLAESSTWITFRIENPWLIHFSNALFGLRIYFDFCGYSLIALGIARTLGVSLTLNFAGPYLQRNIRQFWRSWHVSLSRWFRDYVYVPLGGNRARFPFLVLTIVFLVSGVWHGAGWNFAIWGLVHALFFGLFLAWGNKVPMPRVLAWALTLLAVTSSWLFFYQLEPSILWSKIKHLVAWREYLTSPFAEFMSLVRNNANAAYLLASAALGVLVIALEWLGLRKQLSPYVWGNPIFAQAAMVFLLVVASPVTDNGFVYFNF